MENTHSTLAHISNILHNIWHYLILRVDQNEIRVSNVILAFFLCFVGLKYYGKFSSGLKSFLHNKMHHDKDAANALEKILSYLLCVAYVVLVLDMANVPLSTFAFIGGALALGIGLGGQNLMNNFISSLVIMFERPVKIGDVIEIDGIVGTVSAVEARCIALTTQSNVEVLVPNSKLMQSMVVNWTWGNNIVRSQALLRIDKASHKQISHDKIIEDLEGILKNIKNILESPAPLVYLTKVDEHYYTYQLNFCCDIANVKIVESLQSAVNLALAKYWEGTNFTIEHLNLVIIKPDPEKHEAT